MNDENPKIQPIITAHYKYLKIVVVVLLVVIGCQTIYCAAWNSDKHTDFLVYCATGEAVLHHTDICKAHDAKGWSYLYLPASAILLAPFAKPPFTLMTLV